MTTQGYRPPAIQRQYDACVVGSQGGGAVAAALLARRGFRVLEVDHDGRGAGYVDGGYLLPWRPALFPSHDDLCVYRNDTSATFS